MPIPPIKILLLKTTCILCGVLGLLFLLLWPLSYRYYTTLGIDRDQRMGGIVQYRYYRIRWPGDGSFRIGGGASYYQYGTKPLEAFDLGGRFFKPSRRDSPGSLWNRLGFWMINRRYDDRWSRQDESLEKPGEYWFGIPSVLPGAGLLFVAGICRRRLKRVTSVISGLI